MFRRNPTFGFKTILNKWSLTAVLEEDGSVIKYTPPNTDRLEIEVICPDNISPKACQLVAHKEGSPGRALLYLHT